MKHPEFESSFREWLASRLDDFGHKLRKGEDPEVTFSAKIKDLPQVTCQIRLVDLPGVYTREDLPIEVIEEGRK